MIRLPACPEHNRGRQEIVKNRHSTFDGQFRRLCAHYGRCQSQLGYLTADTPDVGRFGDRRQLNTHYDHSRCSLFRRLPFNLLDTGRELRELQDTSELPVSSAWSLSENGRVAVCDNASRQSNACEELPMGVKKPPFMVNSDSPMLRL